MQLSRRVFVINQFSQLSNAAHMLFYTLTVTSTALLSDLDVCRSMTSIDNSDQGRIVDYYDGAKSGDVKYNFWPILQKRNIKLEGLFFKVFLMKITPHNLL